MTRTYKDGRDTAKGSINKDESGAKSALMIRMTPELKVKLRKASQKARRSMNNLICYLLEKALRSGSSSEPEVIQTTGEENESK